MLSSLRQRLRGRREIGRLSAPSRQVLQDRLTYLSTAKLRVLEEQLRRIRDERVEGSVVECGIALGGSAIALARLAPDRPFHGYDVFGMIPPPSEADPPEVHERYAIISSGKSSGIDGDVYYGYRDSLYEEVEASFARHGVPVGDRIKLHRGLFEDTLHPDGPVALAHVDSDWHDPVKLCLERLWPALSPGGLVVLDDYNDYGGCAQAVDDFLARTADAEMEQTDPNAVLRKRSVNRP